MPAQIAAMSTWSGTSTSIVTVTYLPSLRCFSTAGVSASSAFTAFCFSAPRIALSCIPSSIIAPAPIVPLRSCMRVAGSGTWIGVGALPCPVVVVWPPVVAGLVVVVGLVLVVVLEVGGFGGSLGGGLSGGLAGGVPPPPGGVTVGVEGDETMSGRDITLFMAVSASSSTCSAHPAPPRSTWMITSPWIMLAGPGRAGRCGWLTLCAASVRLGRNARGTVVITSVCADAPPGLLAPSLSASVRLNEKYLPPPLGAKLKSPCLASDWSSAFVMTR